MGRYRKILVLGLVLLVSWFAQTPAHAETPMTFYMETNPQDRWISKMVRNGVEDIYASGDIIEGTTDKFMAFVRLNDVKAAKIHFNSPGGSLLEGIKLGRAIRAMQFFTTVGVYSPKYDPDAGQKSICASACAYAFAGGTSRFLDQYTGRLGVHQFYSKDDAGVSGETVQQISGLIVAYLDQMGIDAKAFTISTFADRNGIIWLTPADALKLRFANNGDDLPVAEIKIAGMVPYLRIQQDHHDVTVRVIFLCADKQLAMQYGIVTDSATAAMFAENQKRSYFELDNREFLAVAGKAGAEAQGSVTWISRTMAPTSLSQILKADRFAAWIDGFGAVRYGGSLDMPTVRQKIADYAKQCYGY